MWPKSPQVQISVEHKSEEHFQIRSDRKTVSKLGTDLVRGRCSILSYAKNYRSGKGYQKHENGGCMTFHGIYRERLTLSVSILWRILIFIILFLHSIEGGKWVEIAASSVLIVFKGEFLDLGSGMVRWSASHIESSFAFWNPGSDTLTVSSNLCYSSFNVSPRWRPP